MSNDQKTGTIERVADYDFKDILAFFKHVGGRHPCEACGNEKWANLPGKAMIQMSYIDGSGFGVHFLPLFCTNCGNTRLFNRSRIDHFIEKELPELKNGADD